MKKCLLLILMVPAIWVLLILTAFSQEDMTEIKDDGFQKKQRPPVVFKHDFHNETAEIEACNECHHLYENGKKLEDDSSEDQLCSDCHSDNSPETKTRLKKAFHLNCKRCHLEQKKGPIMCGSCHVR